MTLATKEHLNPRALRPAPNALLRRSFLSPRPSVYAVATLAAVLVSYFLGKELLWDTMYYHVYAGFSALHERFRLDYFAAGPQGYFNPYGYVPFFLLIRSSLTPLEDASILAVLQSAIVWLTYEVALLVTPRDQPKARIAVAALAAVFAFMNPILINEFGSSYIDVTTAELVLAAWLMLVRALHAPCGRRVVGAALLLGAASALKPTNAVHAVAAGVLVLFLPSGRWRRISFLGIFAAGAAVAFLLVNLPWSLHLERNFGNPFFPLFNTVFRSPYYSTASILDYRFIPDSLWSALWRPFAVLNPVPMVQYELSAPDLRYALLCLAGFWIATHWVWRRCRVRRELVGPLQRSAETRALAALACAFLADWIMWLVVSGNGRYFLPMACVAAILVMAAVFRICADRRAVRNYLLVAILAVQALQLIIGCGYRVHLPWSRRPWYSVSVPSALRGEQNLYLMVGYQTYSLIIPDMPAGSAFVNLGGDYMLEANSPNGRRVQALIQRFEPHVLVVSRDRRTDASRQSDLADVDSVNDALEPFGLKAQKDACLRIILRGVAAKYTVATGGRAYNVGSRANDHTEYLDACRVAPLLVIHNDLLSEQRSADLAFDHLERACPALFQPLHPGDRIEGNSRVGYFFARQYSGTGVMAWIARGTVRFEKLIGGRDESVGSEQMWQQAVPRVVCGRTGAGFLRRIRSRP